MRDHKAPTRRTASIPGNESWLISLGDLLTLLVCFFLVLTPQTLLNARTPQGSQRVSYQERGPRDFGIDLASHGLDRIPAAVGMLPVGRDQLVSTDSSGDQTGHVKLWLAELQSALERGDRVVVQLCDREVEQKVVADVAMYSADRQASLTSLQFEVNSDCGVYKRGLGSSEQLAAVVMFTRN